MPVAPGDDHPAHEQVTESRHEAVQGGERGVGLGHGDFRARALQHVGHRAGNDFGARHGKAGLGGHLAPDEAGGNQADLHARAEQLAPQPVREAAQAELDTFAQGPWGQKFPTVTAAWQRAWDKVIPFFAFPPHIRKVIYTTNAIESVNAQLRKIIKTRGHFPSDDAATKLIWLALRNITADWSRASRDWKEAMNQFAILYEDRFIGKVH